MSKLIVAIVLLSGCVPVTREAGIRRVQHAQVDQCSRFYTSDLLRYQCVMVIRERCKQLGLDRTCGEY